MRTACVRGPVLFGVAVAAVVSGSPPPPAIALQIERVSVSTAGEEGDQVSHSPALAADGHLVAFVSAASNLAGGSSSGSSQILVHDRRTRTTELVSKSGAGTAGDRDSAAPALGADGRYVAFESLAANLVSGDTNGLSDIFVRDRTTGVTERVSVDSAGRQANGPSFSPAISADGRHVAFESRATNLVTGDTNGRPDVFVHDRTSRRTERVSVSNTGAQGNGDSLFASISADGRYVAFTSDATNLVSGDTNLSLDVFVRDRSAPSTQRMSVSSSGVQGNAASFFPSLGADGRFVAFLSNATNLVTGTTPGVARVYVRDRSRNTSELVSKDSAGSPATSSSFAVSITSDGASVVFDSIASNLVAGDNNRSEDVFLHVRASGATERFSVSAVGSEGNGDSHSPSISADGHTVAFASTASNLVPRDTNGVGDVFVVTDCTDAVCGDGTFQLGCEQCDDGNTVDGDGCSGGCQTELTRGGGPKPSDCIHEWMVSPPGEFDRSGMPSGRVTCTDDDPTCDFGADQNDGSCTFRVALCFNVTEPRFECTPSDVARVDLKRPDQEQPKDELDTANRDALEAALKSVGARVGGRCSSGRIGNLCTAPSDCDSSPNRGDGYCRGRFVAMEPPLATPDRCTPFALIEVPLRRSFLRGEKVLRIVTTPSSVPGAPSPLADQDSLRLRCIPAEPASSASESESPSQAAR